MSAMFSRACDLLRKSMYHTVMYHTASRYSLLMCSLLMLSMTTSCAIVHTQQYIHEPTDDYRRGEYLLSPGGKRSYEIIPSDLKGVILAPHIEYLESTAFDNPWVQHFHVFARQEHQPLIDSIELYSPDKKVREISAQPQTIDLRYIENQNMWSAQAKMNVSLDKFLSAKKMILTVKWKENANAEMQTSVFELICDRDWNIAYAT